MNSKKIVIPAKALSTKAPAMVTTFKLQGQGALLCGLLLADQSLWRVEVDSKHHVKEAQNMKLESFLGENIYGVMGGLQSTLSGDMAFSVLHPGMASGALSFLAGGSLSSKDIEGVKKYILGQEGGIGLGIRHSILQYSKGDFSVRRSKEPGSIIDVYQLGDHVFGLHPKSFWQEPYLKTDKREILRKDLMDNWALHRSEDGTLWFVGRDQKLYRFSPGDIQALPTTQKLKSGVVMQSAASPVGGWLIGLSTPTELFRVRRNPVNGIEELDYFVDLPGAVSALATAEGTDGKGWLGVLIQNGKGVELWMASLEAQEDQEDKGPLPELKKVGVVEGLYKGEHLQLKAVSGDSFVAYSASSSEEGPKVVSSVFTV